MNARQVERIHTAPGGIRRAAKLRQCLRCDGWTLVGLDDDYCARVVAVDPRPITVSEEIQAILAGRWTVDAVVWSPGRPIRLEHRDPFRLKAPRRWTVLAEHACPGVVPDLTWLPSRPTVPDTGEVPY